MKISYSSAQSVDILLIYTFCKDLIAAYETDSIDMEKVLPWCRRKIEASLSEYHRILKDGETAGYIHICPPEGNTVELDDFYLHEPFRGQGIGSAVLRGLCADADAKGQNLLLYCFRKNEGALRLYERFGFAVIDTAGGSRFIMERKSR